MAVVTITSPAKFEEVSAEGFGTCCGLAPKVQKVTPMRNRRGGWVGFLVNCSNPECDFHPEDSGVFAADCDIHAKWERYRHGEGVLPVQDAGGVEGGAR